MYIRYRNYWWSALVMVAGLVLFVLSCKKTDDGLSSHFTISPDSGPAGNVVTITGGGFGSDITQLSVAFNGRAAHVLNMGPNKLQVLVPDSVTTGPVTVTVGGRTVTGPVYRVSAVSISSLSVTAGLTGDSVKIMGMGLSDSGSLQGLAGLPAVTFNGKKATVISATPTQVVALVPGKAGIGLVKVAIGGDTATGPVFNYLGVDTIHPITGNVGTIITMPGGFGTTPAQDTVTIAGVKAKVDSAFADHLVVTVPAGANTGTVEVRAMGRLIFGPVFTFVAAPTIAGVAPLSGPAGIKVTITGTGFSKVLAEDVVTFNGVAGTMISASPTQLVVAAPAGVTTGHVVVSVNNQAVNGPVFTAEGLGVSSLSSTFFIPLFTDTISGVGFSVTPSGNTVTFNGTAATVISASDTQLVVTVPAGVTSGTVSVQVGVLTALAPAFSTYGEVTFAGQPGVAGSAVGQGSQAQFNQPYYITMDASGNSYVWELGGDIRKIDPTGMVSSFLPAGTFQNFTNFVFDKHSGNLYVADQGANTIYQVTTSGSVSVLFSPNLPSGNSVNEVTVDASGNLYICDGGNNVYEYTSSGTLINTLTVSVPSGSIYSLIIDPQGNLWSADSWGNIFKGTQQVVVSTGYSGRVIAFEPDGTLVGIDGATGTLFKLASGSNKIVQLTGTAYPLGQAGGYMDGPLPVVQMNAPASICVDSYGIMYVVDFDNQLVRKVSLK